MFTSPAGSASLLLLSSLLGTSIAQSLLPFPIPDGVYNTSVSTMELVDHDRLDPYSNITEPRAVMISLFRPVECNADQIVQYATPDTAAAMDEYFSSAGIPEGSLERVELQVCDQGVIKNDCEDELPVIVLSHGLGGIREFHNGLAQWIASRGYHVVTIDHTYDALFVQFPDGRVVHGVIDDASPESMAKAVDTRKKDSKFVLDQMANATVIRELIPGATEGLDVRRSAIVGHSLGGATAANALADDPRMMGAVNMDGSVYGPAKDIDQTRPFLLFASGIHNQTNDSTWSDFLSHLKGWERGLIYHPAEHLSFTDGPMLMKMLGVDTNDLPPGVDFQMGTVDGLRSVELVSAYIVAFLDFVLKGGEEGILAGPASEYPEITFDL